jgi:hypothetical protein
MEMLHRPLGEILPFRDPLRLRIAFDDRATDSPLRKPDGEREANGPASDDGDFGMMCFAAIHSFLEVLVLLTAATDSVK